MFARLGVGAEMAKAICPTCHNRYVSTLAECPFCADVKIRNSSAAQPGPGATPIKTPQNSNVGRNFGIGVAIFIGLAILGAVNNKNPPDTTPADGSASGDNADSQPAPSPTPQPDQDGQGSKQAQSLDLPLYDVDANCGRFEPTQLARNGCISREQNSYDILKGTWDDVDADIRSKCLGIVAGIQTPMKYAVMESCIAQFDSVRQMQKPQHFQPG